MLNLLLCYSMIMTMKDAGCFAAAADFIRRTRQKSRRRNGIMAAPNRQKILNRLSD